LAKKFQTPGFSKSGIRLREQFYFAISNPFWETALPICNVSMPATKGNTL